MIEVKIENAKIIGGIIIDDAFVGKVQDNSEIAPVRTMHAMTWNTKLAKIAEGLKGSTSNLTITGSLGVLMGNELCINITGIEDNQF